MVGNHVSDIVARYGADGADIPKALTDYIEGPRATTTTSTAARATCTPSSSPTTSSTGSASSVPVDEHLAKLEALHALGVDQFAIYLQHDARKRRCRPTASTSSRRSPTRVQGQDVTAAAVVTRTRPVRRAADPPFDARSGGSGCRWRSRWRRRAGLDGLQGDGRGDRRRLAVHQSRAAGPHRRPDAAPVPGHPHPLLRTAARRRRHRRSGGSSSTPRSSPSAPRSSASCSASSSVSASRSSCCGRAGSSAGCCRTSSSSRPCRSSRSRRSSWRGATRSTSGSSLAVTGCRSRSSRRTSRSSRCRSARCAG